MKNESDYHKDLKSMGVDVLLNLGFSRNEIFEELYVRVPNHNSSFSNQYYGCYIDVAGINSDMKVAVECGDVLEPDVRIMALLLKFDKVIWLPYLPLTYVNNTANMLKTWKRK